MTEIFETPQAIRAWSADRHRRGRRVALVPTMGALHDGHLALIDEAARHADDVVVSIFVNPLQFNRRDDFDRYPRGLDTDLEHCRRKGVTAVYMPTAHVMYPDGFDTHVEPGVLAEPLEGASRPGHFRGVATVVAKLFNAVRPDAAVFGQKDFQQLAVVRRMVLDLDMGIDIVGLPTVRESDGVAMSSRNSRLDVDQRRAARVVPTALDAVEAALTSGASDIAVLRRAGAAVVGAEPLARLDHLELVDPDTLAAATDTRARLLAVIAVWFGDVRLIDNRLLNE